MDLLKAAAWPLTVFVLGLVYRKPLTDAIRRMTEIQGPGVKASFRRDLDARHLAPWSWRDVAPSPWRVTLESVGVLVANTVAESAPESEPHRISAESAPEVGPRLITEGRRPLVFTGTPLNLIEKSWGIVVKTLSTAVAAGLAPAGDVPAILEALVEKKIISEDARDSVLGLSQLMPRAPCSQEPRSAPMKQPTSRQWQTAYRGCLLGISELPRSPRRRARLPSVAPETPSRPSKRATESRAPKPHPTRSCGPPADKSCNDAPQGTARIQRLPRIGARQRNISMDFGRQAW